MKPATLAAVVTAILESVTSKTCSMLQVLKWLLKFDFLPKNCETNKDHPSSPKPQTFVKKREHCCLIIIIEKHTFFCP